MIKKGGYKATSLAVVSRLYKTRAVSTVRTFLRRNWIGAVVILAATLIFFWPLVTRIDSYSEGGDAMFNAWVLARDQNCILGQGCPDYTDGNIFFPHKDSMLYSETQLSSGLLTLPLRFINDNPIFSYSVLAIASFFFMGFFMYLLAKYLSKGNEFVSILAGLIFAYAPFRMAALSHLQNNSIFYLPLAFLLIFKFFDTKNRNYLIGLFVALVLQFYASWYQMVYVLIAVGLLLAGYGIFKLVKPKLVLVTLGVVCLAALSTLPLAKAYSDFAKATNSAFSIKDQATYSAAALDYVIPHDRTPLGKLFYRLNPTARRNSYNLDSYSYFGMTLYALAAVVIFLIYKGRKRSAEIMRQYKRSITFAAIGLAGVIVSLGPVLKLRTSGSYAIGGEEGVRYSIALPYILVSKFLPQLNFMRALGRAGVLVLFSLCCFLALSPLAAKKFGFYQKRRRLINVILVGLIAFELFPLHLMPMRTDKNAYNLSIPPVYKLIKDSDQIDNILVMSADFDYPGMENFPVWLPEVTMWSGYHNKNIFNGYSGYLPPDYYPTYWDFHAPDSSDVAKLNKLDLRYVLIDKQLSSSNPEFANQVGTVLGNDIVYQDDRYVLFKIP